MATSGIDICSSVEQNLHNAPIPPKDGSSRWTAIAATYGIDISFSV